MLINHRRSGSRMQAWLELMSKIRWLVLACWNDESHAVIVLRRPPKGPLTVYALAAIPHARAMADEMLKGAYDLEIREQGHSP